MSRAAIILLLLSATPAWSQAWTPPYCTGTNMALQYNQQGWQCVKITGEPGPTGPAGPQGPQGPPGAALPAQPPPSQCITSNWNGTAWTCVPTDYLTAGTAQKALRATDSNGCEWTLTGPGPATVVTQWQQVNPADPRCAAR
jgi:hypothetical protein